MRSSFSLRSSALFGSLVKAASTCSQHSHKRTQKRLLINRLGEVEPRSSTSSPVVHEDWSRRSPFCYRRWAGPKLDRRVWLRNEPQLYGGAVSPRSPFFLPVWRISSLNMAVTAACEDGGSEVSTTVSL